MTRSEDFAKAIAFARWPIFKMVSILEYLVLFPEAFCKEEPWMICRMDFEIVFGILIFDPKWGFCKGYSLCMITDFQSGLFPRIFSVFWSGYFTQNTYKWFVEWILTCFLELLFLTQSEVFAKAITWKGPSTSLLLRGARRPSRSVSPRTICRG